MLQRSTVSFGKQLSGFNIVVVSCLTWYFTLQTEYFIVRIAWIDK